MILNGTDILYLLKKSWLLPLMLLAFESWWHTTNIPSFPSQTFRMSHLWLYLNSLRNEFSIFRQWISLGPSSCFCCLFLLLAMAAPMCREHTTNHTVVGRIMGPRDVHILIHRTCEHVPLHGTVDFVDVIDLKILRQGDFPGLAKWVQGNHKCAFEKSGKSRVRGRSEDATLLALKTEEGATCQGVQAAFRTCEKQGSRFSPRTSRRKAALMTPWF